MIWQPIYSSSSLSCSVMLYICDHCGFIGLVSLNEYHVSHTPVHILYREMSALTLAGEEKWSGVPLPTLLVSVRLFLRTGRSWQVKTSRCVQANFFFATVATNTLTTKIISLLWRHIWTVLADGYRGVERFWCWSGLSLVLADGSVRTGDLCGEVWPDNRRLVQKGKQLCWWGWGRVAMAGVSGMSWLLAAGLQVHIMTPYPGYSPRSVQALSLSTSHCLLSLTLFVFVRWVRETYLSLFCVLACSEPLCQ